MKMPSSYKVIKQHNIGTVEDIHVKAPSMMEQTAGCPGGHSGRERKDPFAASGNRGGNNGEGAGKAAEKEKAKILEAAEKDARELRNAAYSMGYEKGRQEALLEYRNEFSGYMKKLDEKLAEHLQRAEEIFFQIEQLYQEDMVRLAVAVAGRYIEKNFNGEQLRTQVEKVLEDLMKEESIYIKVHPCVYRQLEDSLEEFRVKCPDSRIRLLKDTELTEKEFVCETGDRYMKFSPADQLEELVRELVKLREEPETYDAD